jgi:hypothetical protein
MTPEEIASIQKELNLSDGKIAASIGVTRQTWRNWRRGCRCPMFAQNALRWMMELRRLDAANDNLPVRVRKLSIVGAAALSCANMAMIVAA